MLTWLTLGRGQPGWSAELPAGNSGKTSRVARGQLNSVAVVVGATRQRASRLRAPLLCSRNELGDIPSFLVLPDRTNAGRPLSRSPLGCLDGTGSGAVGLRGSRSLPRRGG